MAESPAKMQTPGDSASPVTPVPETKQQPGDDSSKQLVPRRADTQTVVQRLLPDAEAQDIYLMASLSRNIIVAQCVYYLSVFSAFSKSLLLPPESNGGEEIKEDSKSEILLIENEYAAMHEFKVGLIGCGRIGRALLLSILRSKLVKAENLLVSTRQPGLLKDLSSRHNIRIVFDNELVGSTCDLIFVSCLPLQFEGLAPELRRALKSRAHRKPLIVSLMAGMSGGKVVRTVFSGESTAVGRSAGVITTKVNTKRLRMALAKEGESIGKQKITASLGRMYKKISGPQSNAEGLKARLEEDAEQKPRAETPSLSSLYSGGTAIEEAQENDYKIIKEFVTKEAAGGLAGKRGEEVVGWVQEFGLVFPELGTGKIAETMLGEGYAGCTVEKLMERKEEVAKSAEEKVWTAIEVLKHCIKIQRQQ